jgi:hypothetical protein
VSDTADPVAMMSAIDPQQAWSELQSILPAGH